MAGARLCAELVAQAPQRYDILVLGAEPEPAYNRVLLSSVLAGEIDEAALSLHPQEFYASHHIKMETSAKAVALDAAGHSITLADGRTIAFDRLVLATGSQPLMPPLPGMGLEGVMAFRDLADTRRLQALAARAAEVVVIGGGLLGLEAAAGLVRRGAKVRLLHLMDRLMERQLDHAGAAHLRRAMERRGIVVEIGASTSAIRGEQQVEGVALADGRSFGAQAVVWAIGIKPEITLARSAGLETGRGIKVDDRMRTSHADIYALGECAEHRAQVYGLVEPAYAQAAALASHLGGGDAAYEGSVLATHLKIAGVGIFSCGDVQGAQGTSSAVLEDAAGGIYRKVVTEGDRLKGAVLVGDTEDAGFYRDLLAQGTPIGGFGADLVFGPQFFSTGTQVAA
ncbi:MAG: FAD-dependent oxidoreductase [Hyphomicrobiales bacterium]|nr:FAD-dependent oxidoreductase [Hyphomicrobiales bacterium]